MPRNWTTEAVAIFSAVTTAVAYYAASLRSKLQGRQPCQRWLAHFAGMIAAAAVFTTWMGSSGLGAVEPGFRGALFGVFAGIVWGGIFSYFNARVLWRAFDTPSEDYEAEYEKTMHTDLRVLFSQAVQRLLAFKPTPRFKASGILPWALFLAALLLPIFWACTFCLIIGLTEGTPVVKAVLPAGQ